MFRRLAALLLTPLLLALAVATTHASKPVDSGVIRLSSPRSAAPADSAPEIPSFSETRRAFDYEIFEGRLEALWFQRKLLLAQGRDDDAARQAELIRSFCNEEGVRRVETMAGALLAEAARYLDEGHYARALRTIDLAESFDPGRPQVHMARAKVRWGQASYVRAIGDLLRALRRSVFVAASDLSLINQSAIVLVVALLGCTALFALMMIARYQVPLRHEVEEWLAQRDMVHWSPAAGWGLALLPFLLWFGAGWAAVYWIVLVFRYMRRGERLAAVVLLCATALAVPAYRVGVALYGLTADPVFRTTLDSVDEGYDPDKIVKLRNLVDGNPDDPVYRFLLAGSYKQGRYFEQAYEQYRKVLELETSIYQADVNIGNIYQKTGRHAEAVSSYLEALDKKPDSVLAYFNMHLAQSESFHFKEAEQSLDRARIIDAKRTSELMELSRRGDHAQPIDAFVDLGSIWAAALEGKRLRETFELQSSEGMVGTLLPQLFNPVSVVAGLALCVCGVVGALSSERSRARRCIRCGRPFCHYCRSGRQGQEYCSQCLHLFVIGDGLAPETKNRKLYEVERHERRTRGARRLLSVVLPGTAHLLRGRAARGCVLIGLWLAALVAWLPSLLVPLERVLGVDLRLDLLRGGAVPGIFALNATATLAAVGAMVVWLAGNLWRWRGREA